MIAGILFDKDGTLFDFHATWGDWAANLLQELAGGDAARAEALGEAVGFDTARHSFAPDSPMIGGTPDEAAEALLPYLPGRTLAALVARMNALAAEAQAVPALSLTPLLEGLRGRGLCLGVATNDAETAARAHLAAAGVAGFFDYIAGFDSGYGGKPQPGMLLAFTRATGLRPDQVVMVGDSLHDLAAGRAAGMHTLAVLTGLATPGELAPLADAVLPDIGHIPDWLDSRPPANPIPLSESDASRR